MKTAIGIVLTVSVLWLVGGCGKPVAAPPASPPTAAAPAATTQPAATAANLGPQIFATGIGANGQHIAFSGGSDRFKAKPAGCVGCHGADGKGKSFGKASTPNITYAALRGGAKPLYPSDDAVLTAIREGKDQTGQPLDRMMPHWQVTDEEGKALLGQLKALDKAGPAKPAGA